MAYDFAASAEREAQRITADYRTYLNRDPEAGAVDGWVNAFLQGASNENVIAGFVGSTEYFQTHSDNSRDWLSAAYQSILGRQASVGEANYWLSILGNDS